jgi:hypothetical protein
MSGVENIGVSRAALTDSQPSTVQGGSQGAQLPDPLYPSGPPAVDLQTAIAVLEIQSSHENRVGADQERAAAEKAQEEAHAKKIAKMREVADDTFTAALVDGAFQGLSAAAQFGAAVESYSSTVQGLNAKACPELSDAIGRSAAVSERASKLLEASSKAMSAAGTIWTGAEKSAIEGDRADVAVFDQDIDRAKNRVDGASTQSKRADDDIHDTMAALKEYVAAKGKAAQAAILKG